MTIFQKVKTVFYILKHKVCVLYYACKFCKALLVRAVKHDLSKFSKEEFEYVYKLTNGNNIKFGSKEYYDLVDSVLPAKEAHSKRNSHHPEFYGSIYWMSPIDLCEMMCDWAAATKGKNGKLDESVVINTKKYNISDLLLASLTRDLKEIRALK